jgi:hypothetical protein
MHLSDYNHRMNAFFYLKAFGSSPFVVISGGIYPHIEGLLTFFYTVTFVAKKIK